MFPDQAQYASGYGAPESWQGGYSRGHQGQLSDEKGFTDKFRLKASKFTTDTDCSAGTRIKEITFNAILTKRH